jgi:hypothetical protein
MGMCIYVSIYMYIYVYYIYIYIHVNIHIGVNDGVIEGGDVVEEVNDLKISNILENDMCVSEDTYDREVSLVDNTLTMSISNANTTSNQSGIHLHVCMCI